MENQVPQTEESTSSKTPLMLIGGVVVILLIAVAAFAMTRKEPEVATTPAAQQEQAAPTQAVEGEAMAPTEPVDAMSGAVYENGEYEAEGEYTSPGGQETIDVTLTIANDVVTDAEVTANATRPISKQMQDAFIEGYKEMVVGKKLDEINLGKVSSSSLAPKGFNDAVTKIKAEAKA